MVILREVFVIVFLIAASARVGLAQKEPVSSDLEYELRRLFELLRDILKNGNADLDVPPLEPLHFKKLPLNFYLKDTELKGYFRDVCIRNLSDFRIANLTATIMPKMRFELGVAFDELFITGFYSLLGTLFDEFLINGLGNFELEVRNLLLTAELTLYSKAGVLQVRDVSADFKLRNVTLTYQNVRDSDVMKQMDERFVQDILTRVRNEYLPDLLKLLKILMNDFLLGWSKRIKHLF